MIRIFFAQKLAELVGADTLIILTAVDYVYINYNQPNQKRLESIGVDELKKIYRGTAICTRKYASEN
ncbi:amino acid kinase family protein [Bacillus cytotoxicus]